MQLKHALTILGPERIRRGLRAIENRRNLPGGASCFVGEAFGGTYRQFLAVWKDRTSPIFQAAAVCEQYFEGWSQPRADPKRIPEPQPRAIPPSRVVLHAACKVFLTPVATRPMGMDKACVR